MDDPERRARLIALLDANHRFPGPFSLAVVTHNRAEIRRALQFAIESELRVEIGDGAWQEQLSAGGRFVSHRVTVLCQDADQVLAVFARIHAVEGVLQVL